MSHIPKKQPIPSGNIMRKAGPGQKQFYSGSLQLGEGKAPGLMNRKEGQNRPLWVFMKKRGEIWGNA
jgi:hypothetical protein